MALLDPFQDPTFMDSAGAFSAAPTPQAEPMQAMTQPMDVQGPKSGFGGFLEGLTKTGEDGVTFADKLFAAGGILQSDPDAMAGINAKRSEFKTAQKSKQMEEAERQRKAKASAALKAAYQGGKFNPQAYIDAMAGDVGLEDLTAAQKLAPQGGVEGGYAYTKDPFTGQVTFGEQRPISRAEQLAQDRFDEQERRNQVLEQIAMGNLGVRQGQLGLSRQREGRMASQPQGGGQPQAAPNAPRISTPAQLQALPAGSLYVAPDGTTRRKR